MDRSVSSPRTRSVAGVRGPGVSVFGLPEHKKKKTVVSFATVVAL